MTTGTQRRPDRALEPAERRASESLAWVSLAARLVFAAVLVYAAATKVGDPPETVRAVRAYKILPESLAVPFAHALPWFELALAVLLVTGLAVRLCGLVSTALMAVFVAGMVSAWARGLKIDCGCFGGGGPNPDPQYVRDLFRDGAFLAIALAVALIPRSKYALDPGAPPPAATAPEGSTRRDRQRAANEARRRERVVRHRRKQSLAAAAVLALSALVGVGAGAAMTPGPPEGIPRGANARGGIVVGSPDAPRLVVVYEDPQCPSCERFERTTGRLLEEAVDRGLVRVEYRMRSFLGPESVRAVAALGAAADEGRFSELRQQVFAHQPPEGTGGFTIDDLLRLGRAAGLTGDRFVGAVRSQKYAGWAAKVDDLASRDGNVLTPELVVDGRPVPNQVLFDGPQFAAVLGLSS